MMNQTMINDSQMVYHDEESIDRQSVSNKRITIYKNTNSGKHSNHKDLNLAKLNK